jgi:uncharacterized membrane protein
MSVSPLGLANSFLDVARTTPGASFAVVARAADDQTYAAVRSLESGVVEISLGAALIFLPRQKALLGGIAGAFFTCILPGNIAQYTHRRNAFGLDTDGKRFARLFFQPVLVAWALWSTRALRRRHQKASLTDGSPVIEILAAPEIRK